MCNDTDTAGLGTRRAGLMVVFVLAVPSIRSAGQSPAGDPAGDRGRFVVQAASDGTLQLDGFVGRRVRANVQRWLLPAPHNNPGLLDMFARRDRGESPDLVPWAGEFVGKYLISAVQAMRMTADPELEESLHGLVDRLIALQADDGYLGPWPRHERLRRHWDLWGHYHVMLGLLGWHELTGDAPALRAARRIGDLVCHTFLDSELRLLDVGSHEMNMAIIHGMALLYRRTREPRYLQMAQAVLKEFKQAGDYYRTGLAGREFFRTPKPRWESLHDLQGLVQLYVITGDPTFRTAFLHHWASMRRFDYRNTGGFSSGEQATGNPYVNNAIETCCVVAFQEVMIDALRLTGDARIADDLERTTLNAMLGAQHPSGAWCTYNTPMSGRRIPSHVDIRFQARPETPHLNCCSVNGPRGYGSLVSWALMRRADGVAINYYGPLHGELDLPAGGRLRVRQVTDYPVDGAVAIHIEPPEPRPFTVALRIPAWSQRTRVAVNGDAIQGARPGSYLKIARTWRRGDTIHLGLDLRLRYESGDGEQFGRVSVFRGPILLAADDRYTRFGTAAEPGLEVDRLSDARLVPAEALAAAAGGPFVPWLGVDVPATGGQSLRLIDFASAGNASIDGQPLSAYTTWLPADNVRPPPPVAWLPADRSRIAPGALRFVWRRPADAATGRRHTVLIAAAPDFQEVVLRHGDAAGETLLVPAAAARCLKAGTTYYWKVVARNEHGSAASCRPYKRFTIDPGAPPAVVNWPYGQRESDAVVTAAPLRGTVRPSYGTLRDSRGWQAADGRSGGANGSVALDGKTGRIRYEVLRFPERDYAVSIRVCVTARPATALGQVFSAWAAGMDDPLRIVMQDGQLFARLEAREFYGTSGVPIEVGRWYHVAAVKQAEQLRLYIDGTLRATAKVPATVQSAARDVALGGNPHFHGPEYLAVRLADFKLFARALSAAEVRALSGK